MIDGRQFRNALGRFATGVTVITTVEEERVHGMTANAFTSVSLDPPLVCVSIDHKAKMHQLLPKTGIYGVSILGEDQQEVSQHFVGRPLDKPPSLFWNDGFAFIQGSVAQLACEVVAAHSVGDHTLYIGRVKWLWFNEEGLPLIFFAGQYRGLSN